MEERYPNTKEIIYMLGIGTLLLSTIFMPGLGYAVGAIERSRRKYEWQKSQKDWKKFNLYYLKRNLKRLKEQKIVEVVNQNGQDIIKLTQKGKTKYLKFKLEQLSLQNNTWDGRWRIVIYDISKFKRNQQTVFRNILKYINFFPLQKSVYLTPYPCEEQILYLREYFGIGDEVLLIWADKLENEEIYKEYFGL